MSEQEVREVVNDVLAQKAAEYTWVTGEVTLVTRSSEEIRGELMSADKFSVVVATDGGDRQVSLADVINVLIQMSSPGPE